MDTGIDQPTAGERTHRPTSFDVALRAQVSQSTVSRALRGDPSITPETRDRVAKAAADLGYRPDSRAVRLRGGSVGSVAVVLLTSHRLALVVDQNQDDYTRPRVWTFYDTSDAKVIKPEDINLIDSLGHEDIVSSADPDGYNIPNFGALREMVFTSAAKAMS